MAVAVDATGTHSVITSTGTGANTFTGLTVGAGLSNPAAVFSINYGTGSPTFSSVTCNGVACFQIGTVSSSGVGGIALFGVVGVASGLATFHFTPSVSVEAYVEGSSFQNVLQTGGATTFANFASTFPAGNVTTRSLTITTAVGNYAICAGNFGTVATTAFTAPTGVTIVYRDASDPASVGVQAAAARFAPIGASTIFTGANAASDSLGLAGFNLVQAAASAAVTIGWSRPSDSDRYLSRSFPVDESRQYFRAPSAFQPIWLPESFKDARPRTGALDQSGQVFPLKPPPPVNTISGMAWTNPQQSAFPAVVTPKPENKFFSVSIQAPSTIAGMAWQNPPDDRPSSKNARHPEDAISFFRSPSSFAPIWLPVRVDWGERLRPILPSLNDAAFVAPVKAATVPISGMAWYNPSEDAEKPPLFMPRPENRFFSVTISAATPISGMAWNPQGDRERLGIVLPDQSGSAFVAPVIARASTIAGIAWLVLDDRGRPLAVLGDPYATQTIPPFIEPPLQQFYAAANADDFNPLLTPRLAEAATKWTPRSFAQPVGISGMAWWRQTEVYPAASPVKDYHAAWVAILAGKFKVLWAIPLNKTTGGSSS